MKFGLTSQELQILSDLVVTPLQNAKCKVWMFGSRVRGTHHKFSDIDLLFEKAQNLPAGLVSKIKTDIENSRLSYKVDLVDIEDLAKSYLDNVFNERIIL